MFHKLVLPLLLSAFLLPSGLLQAQYTPHGAPTASEIRAEIRKLRVTGSVLYMAAHPDDENTRLIAYLANDKGYRTGYLSLTRGDGGQNLIGTEVREELGILRTQELLGARRTDGGEQFFSRANDFGYSKNPEETFTIWDREKVLSDAVWVIRNFRPDVIVTRFSPTRGRTHGHHTASAVLAVEAAEAAGDRTKFPEQLKYVKAWSPKRVLWNTSWWFYRNEEFDKSKLLTVNVGGYSPLLGRSFGEIASMARSMHKCQGFGNALQRGSNTEYLEHLWGERATSSLSEGIDMSWGRVGNASKMLEALLREAEDRFDSRAPEQSVTLLCDALKEMRLLEQTPLTQYKIKKLEDIILSCLGIWFEGNAEDYAYSPGDSINFSINTLKRGRTPVTLSRVALIFPELNEKRELTDSSRVMAYNELNQMPVSVKIPSRLPASQPYWLREKSEKGMFVVDDLKKIGLPENPDPAELLFEFRIEKLDVKIEVRRPIWYKSVNPAKGEIYRPLAFTPAVTAVPDESMLIFASEEPKIFKVRMKAFRKGEKGEFKLDLPKGWKAEPAVLKYNFKNKYDEEEFEVSITPPSEAQSGTLKITDKGGRQAKGYTVIDYDHIPAQTLFPEASLKLVRLDIQTKAKNIAYIMGSGDKVPEALRRIGCEVTVLSDDLIRSEQLAAFDAVIVGIRAYNTNDRIKFHQPTLLEYVKNGGVLIAQYNTSHRLKTKEIGPYPFKLSRDRVTVEEAEIKILDPDHSLLNFPNKITDADFEEWVQERGLYFPSEWDEKYTVLFECNDPGEDPKQGITLYTEYGEGVFIYTAFSWFRELPAGVPGAYRILANMISQGKRESGK